MEPEIFKRIEQAPKADFGDVISKSFELYKTVFTQGLIHTLISLIVVIPFIILVYVPFVPMYADILANAGDPYFDPEITDYMAMPMLIVWVVLIILGSVILQLVSYSIYGHFFKEMKKTDLGTDEDIGGYFTLIKNHFGKMFLLSLASIGIALVAELLCILPLFYVIVPLHWIFPIFVFNEELSVSDIIKAAFKFANKNWLLFAGLGIVVSIMSSLGAILCYVGLLATVFFSYIATYITYRDTIGFDQQDAISEIGEPVSE